MQDYSREMQLLAPSPFLGTSFHFALGFLVSQHLMKNDSAGSLRG